MYDSFSNLSYVLPPKVNTDDGISQVELDELCYQYKYDYRNRLIEKKIPGKGDANTFESIIYNTLDQPILTQDPNQKANNEWLFTKYDALGRVAYTGKVTITGKTRADLQQEANDFTGDLWVSRDIAQRIGGVTMYYNNGGYPNVQNGEVLTISYYDDYNFDLAGLTAPTTVLGQQVDNRTKSLNTGSKIKVLQTGHWITTVTYYNKKARPIYVATKNTYLNTTDITESKLDFVGKVEQIRATHTKDSNAPIVTVDTFEYDHMGRLLNQKQTIGGQEETIVENAYDELGIVTTKKIGGGLQEVDYSFNIRGWLTGINNDSKNDNDVFDFRVGYNNPIHNSTPQFVKNISEVEWKTASDDIIRYYTYDYDAFYRILEAQSNDNRYNLSNVTYDKMGNILTLKRSGAIVENPDYNNAGHFDTMDDLTYSYYDGGNKLKAIGEIVPQPFGFTKNATTGTDYTYDANGNMVTDVNKGITSISYDHNNMPVSIVVNNSNHNGNIQYVYDATGIKLRQTVVEGSNTLVTDYAGSYVYENGVLKQISQPEGYIEPENDGYQYVYQLRDIWTNTRVTFADNDKDGKIDIERNNIDVDGDGDLAMEIRREQNYYPFGLQWRGVNDIIRGVKNDLKTYQSQEFTEDLGLNTFEWRYRISDPSTGRFWQIDPLAESYKYNATYAFQENKMGAGVELEGLELDDFPEDLDDWDSGTGTGTEGGDIQVGAESWWSKASGSLVDGLNAIGDALNYVHEGISGTIADGVQRLMGSSEASTTMSDADLNGAIASGDENAVYASMEVEAAAAYNATPALVGEVGATVVEVAAAELIVGAKGSKTSKPKEAYNRRKHYGNTPTQADRKALGAGKGEEVNHMRQLVKHYYEDGGHAMTSAQRKAFATDRANMEVISQRANRADGGRLSQYSKNMKKKYDLK